MRTLSVSVSILLGFIFVGQFAHSEEQAEVTRWVRRPVLTSEPPNYPDKCPANQDEFSTWYKDLIHGMTSPEQTPIRSKWVAQCQAQFKGAALAEVKKCSANLSSLNVAYDESRYGLNVGPEIPTDQSPGAPELPAVLNDTKLAKIFKEGTDEELRTALNEIIPKLPAGASVIAFYSGSSHARTVTIILPGEKEDVYFHYIGDKNPAHPTSADVIKVHRLDSSGDVASSPKMDYFSFEYVGGAKPATHAMGDRCNSCHRSGTRAIVPEDGVYNIFLKKEQGQAIYDAFDKRRPVAETMRPGISYSHLGPAVGNDLNTRASDASFVAKCASEALPNAKPDQIKKISEKMNCVKCHSEDGREDVLKYPMDVRDFTLNTLDNIITRGHMPQGADDPKSKSYLRPVERKALLRCLKQDYFGGFKSDFWSQGNAEPGTLMKYLTGSCEGDTSPSSSAVSPAGSHGAVNTSRVAPTNSIR